VHYKSLSLKKWKFLQKNQKIYKYMEILSIMVLDKKDLKILEILKENSKLTTNQISKKTMIPVTTVHNRIRKMEKEGVIEGYSLNLDYKKLGKSILAFIFMNPNYNFLRQKKITQQELLDKLAKLPSVEEIYHITGRYDLIAKVRGKDVDELNEFILNILERDYGVMKTDTMIVLSPGSA
jgi:DNA-binding Lrp family transcriptional regulator